MADEAQTAVGVEAGEGAALTVRASVRSWWARHGLVARAVAVLLVLFVVANVVLWGWFLAYSATLTPSNLIARIDCP